MRKLLVCVVAVAGLLGSVLALVASTASPASGQQASITLTNASAGSVAARALGASVTSIGVTITPVSGCNPGARAPLNNGQFTLPMTQRDATWEGGAPEITGLISTNCNWQISYTNPICEVTVEIWTAGDSLIERVRHGRPIILSGLNTGGGQLHYSGMAVSYMRFIVNIGANGGLLSGSTSSVVGERCGSSFTSSMSLGGTAVTAAHTGLEITATYTSQTAGCIGGTLVNRVTAAGGLQFVSASPAQGRGVSGPTNSVSLISETVAQKGTAVSAALGDRCIYSVTVTDTLGNLRLARNAFGLIDPSKTTNRVDGITTGGTANAFLAGSTAVDTIPANVTVTYELYRVAVTVVATYPADEVFTTDDSVDFFIVVNSPCGGFNRVIPSIFGAQGDGASAQVFPGSITVYGSALNVIQNRVGATPARSYDVPAFADARGTQACSVTVTERNGPERCSPVGGASQTKSVAAGSAVMAFEFNHTCEPVAVAGSTSSTEDTVDSTVDGGGSPPAPPALELGGDSATTDAGPRPEGRTG